MGKIGLVLSGGGTRGVAHAGVIKFLNEMEIKPDVISCCSAGSIVGSLYAIGKSPEEILDFFKSVSFFSWKHFTINKPGLVSSAVFKNYLTPQFGDLKIGALGLDLRIVATEMISGDQQVFDRDVKIVDAIIASSSIPGVATPYAINDGLYSDGGILNNFPADVLNKNVDHLIGVYVTPPQVVTKENLSTIKGVTSRAYDLFSHRTEIYKFAYCDWFISSKKLSDYSTFENNSKRLEEIYNIGYQMARDSFEDNEEEFLKLFS